MIHVVAVITAQPGQRDLILEAFRANPPAVLARGRLRGIRRGGGRRRRAASRGCFGADCFMVVKMGIPGGTPGPRGRAAHGGLRREGEGPAGWKGHPRPRSGLRRRADAAQPSATHRPGRRSALIPRASVGARVGEA